ncbi:MAG TPA: hypothetical protein VKZ81_24765 [Pseudonocardia sp.]|uniref:hypothetical protein n=1 Tax=Pseudonocardia sp. TaxID=60912 RepID=UPI002B4B3547|nr:hypothetical protein [Pseudonocardia sp.]HLU58686.1 hypothetical protein [Pseudonocardia sp.]
MLEVGTANQRSEDDDLAVFVDRLAAAGDDQATTDAQARIRDLIAAGDPPPGVRRLAEALAASVADLPPPPRRPLEDASSLVAAVRDNTLVVLEDFDAAATGRAVAALLGDGRRVVVTGADAARLDAVREALPADAADRALSGLPDVPPAESRELRRLLATSTPQRRARGDQVLPPESAVPDAAEVARLCALAMGSEAAGDGEFVLPTLLANLDEERRAAVTSVAERVDSALAAMPAREEHGWAWQLLSELIFGQQRAAFDRMVEDVAEVIAVLDRTRDAPPVSFTAPPPPDAAEALIRYREFLAAGGRARSYFRPAVQRDVEPVLEVARVGARVPETQEDIDRVLEYLELVERQARVDAACTELGVPLPADEHELGEVGDALGRIATAARAVGALRHDVLFIAEDSPLSVPDVETAQEIAAAILEFAVHGSGVDAARRLDALAEELEALSPVSTTAPEHEQAVAALRRRDAADFAAAVDALGAARREQVDHQRCALLQQRLAEGAPRLAEAWAALAETEPAALGFASFVPVEPLLSTLPPSDSADVVLVLGASGLGVERLLLSAVAPRIVGVVAPGEAAGEGPTLLSVLRRANALVIRGRTGGGRVVPLKQNQPRAAAPVGQAG